MIEFAAGEGPLMDPADTGNTPKKVVQAQAALAQALRSTGVEDPAATLRAIRLKVVENERAEPDQSSTRWRANAMIPVRSMGCGGWWGRRMGRDFAPPDVIN